jgi:hypothetical protein
MNAIAPPTNVFLFTLTKCTILFIPLRLVVVLSIPIVTLDPALAITSSASTRVIFRSEVLFTEINLSPFLSPADLAGPLQVKLEM